MRNVINKLLLLLFRPHLDQRGTLLIAKIEVLHHLCKACTAFALRDVARWVRKLRCKALDIGHAHAVLEMLEHDLVVGGVAHIDPAV